MSTKTAVATADALSAIIAKLSAPIPEGEVSERYGWFDKNAPDPSKPFVYVQYIDPTYVMTRLDADAPGWSTTGETDVKIVPGGEKGPVIVATVTLHLTVEGVTRVGVGVNSGLVARDEAEMAIKGAASDALKRAAKEFGLGRQLVGSQRYSEFDQYGKPYRGGSNGGAQNNGNSGGYAPVEVPSPSQAIAQNPDYRATEKQVAALRTMAGKGLPVEEQAKRLYGIEPQQIPNLTKKAASALMDAVKAAENPAVQAVMDTFKGSAVSYEKPSFAANASEVTDSDIPF